MTFSLLIVLAVVASVPVTLSYRQRLAHRQAAEDAAFSEWLDRMRTAAAEQADDPKIIEMVTAHGKLTRCGHVGLHRLAEAPSS